ncbi:MAG TPA: hypothetical protein VLV16_11515 [Gemmatimonadales bacterium]|nr:hypothetical protein [Gemmatimonadales bacterium]
MRTQTLVALVFAGLLAVGCDSSTTTNTVVLSPLPAPDSLGSVSLNRAIELHWADNAFRSAPSRFEWYTVYSTSYNLDTGVCGATWEIEGTTVAPEFLAGALTNGVPRCYTTTAIATDGSESDRSPLWQDTPRPDARNVLVYADGTNLALSGFRFWDDVNGNGTGESNELGLVQSGASTDVDFMIHRNADSSLSIVPVFTGTSVRFYGAGPVADLTSIDFAPASGYGRSALLAMPGYGYVFEIVDGPNPTYGAVRVTHVGRQYLILDWSVQTDPGNPELQLHGGSVVAAPSGSIVSASK